MRKTKSILSVVLITMAILLGFSACCQNCKKDGKCNKETACQKDASNCSKDSASCEKKKDCCKQKSAHYSCPMCKDITSDKPGKCSSCGMDLKKEE